MLPVTSERLICHSNKQGKEMRKMSRQSVLPARTNSEKIQLFHFTQAKQLVRMSKTFLCELTDNKLYRVALEAVS